MTKTQFLHKVRSLMPDTRRMLLRECERLFDSGGVDPDDFGDDYALPKMILSVAMEKSASEWRPLSGDYRGVAHNLQHF